MSIKADTNIAIASKQAGWVQHRVVFDELRYIFGGNQTGESIAMTAPVSMWDDNDTGWLAFTMPSAHALETLPAPHTDGVWSCLSKKKKWWLCSHFQGEQPLENGTA